MKTLAINRLEKNLSNEAYWNEHIKGYERSGLSRKSYCRAHQVHYDRFRYWYRKQSSAVSNPSLIAVKIEHQEALKPAAILASVKLDNNKILNIHDFQVISYLVKEG